MSWVSIPPPEAYLILCEQPLPSGELPHSVWTAFLFWRFTWFWVSNPFPLNTYLILCEQPFSSGDLPDSVWATHSLWRVTSFCVITPSPKTNLIPGKLFTSFCVSTPHPLPSPVTYLILCEYLSLFARLSSSCVSTSSSRLISSQANYLPHFVWVHTPLYPWPESYFIISEYPFLFETYHILCEYPFPLRDLPHSLWVPFVKLTSSCVSTMKSSCFCSSSLSLGSRSWTRVARYNHRLRRTWAAISTSFISS